MCGPLGATGLSTVCNCGISLSNLLTIFQYVCLIFVMTWGHIIFELSIRPCVRPSDFSVSLSIHLNRFQSIYPILFEVGFPNLVY